MADLVSLIAEVLADTDPEWVGEGVCETATWARRAAGVLVDRLNLHEERAMVLRKEFEHRYPTDAVPSRRWVSDWTEEQRDA